MKPRKYQKSGFKACVDILTSENPVSEVVVSPTGAGKSFYIAHAAMSVDYPLIVLQPNKELLKQNFKKYIDMGGEASIYSVSAKEFQRKKVMYTRIDGEEYPCEEIGHVTYATIGSVMKDWEKFKALGVKGMIIDECHLDTRSGSKPKEFARKVGIKNILGLTATPIYLENMAKGATLRMVNTVRGGLFDDIRHVTQIKEVVRAKYWSPLVYKVMQQDGRFLEENSNGSDYTEKSQREFYLKNNIDDKIQFLVDKLDEQGIRKSILIFVPTIQEAHDLQKKIKGSEVVTSKTSMKERERIINDFRNLKIKVVINVNILSVGFDHPELDVIITARPTLSMAIYYQQIGRGVRIHPNKKSCAVIDLSGNYNKFGKVEGLTFENVRGHGWGMFNDKGEILTFYPINASPRPTIRTVGSTNYNSGKEIFTFGKHKGKSIRHVSRKDMQYLIWLTQGDFRFVGKKQMKIRDDLYKFLKLS